MSSWQSSDRQRHLMQYFLSVIPPESISRVGLLIALTGMFGFDIPAADTPNLASKQLSYARVNAGSIRRQEKEIASRPDKASIENHRQQAISLIQRIIDQAQDISDVEVQAAVVSSALALLWKYEEPYAVPSFQKTVDRLLDHYSADNTTPAERMRLAAAIKQLISSVAPRDPAQAEQALDRYKKATARESNENNKGLSLKERLSIAQASLDIDAKQSVALAESILQTGVPTTFPNYLYQLEDRNPELANALYRTALSQLANNPIYSPVQATNLSTYAFREKLLVIEIRTNSSANQPVEFGSLTMNLSPAQGSFNPELAAGYLNVVEGFLRQRLFALQSQSSLDQEYVIQCYFLARKLNAYSAALKMVRDDRWQQLSTQYEILSQRAGVPIAELVSMGRLAERLVAEGTVFRFDDGASAFEKARVSKDAQEKTELLVRGIHELLEAGKFSEAERKIAELKDEKLIAQITDYCNFRAGKSAVAKRKWNDLTAHLTKIVDPRLRTYLLLEGIQTAFKYKKKNIGSDYLQSVVSVASTIDNKSDKAKALVAINGLLSSNESESSSQALLDAITAINQADDYDGRDYAVTIELPKLRLYFPLKDANIATSFQNSSSRDWDGAISATKTINRVEIRAMAQIAACRAIL